MGRSMRRRGLFKLKLSYDDEPIIKAKADKMSDFDSIFKTLKRKFGDKK